MNRRENVRTVAEIYDAKAEYCLKEGERALVFSLNQADFDTCIVEKRDEKLHFLTDTYKVDLEECREEADRRLIEKMKDIVDFERLEAIGIREEDEKNKKAFADFYESLERVKQELARNDEAVVVFENLFFMRSDAMTRQEYRECMLPLYQVCAETVQEMQQEYSVDGFSKIYLAGDKSEDISLYEYLEEQHRAELCILMQ